MVMGQVPNGMNIWVNQQLRRVESAASSNRARVFTARTLAEVVRLRDVSVPPELRSMKNSLPGIRQLESAIETRLDALLKARLSEIAAIEAVEEARTQRGRLMTDCNVLRGHYSHKWRYAENESKRLVYLKEKKGAPSQDQAPT